MNTKRNCVKNLISGNSEKRMNSENKFLARTLNYFCKMKHYQNHSECDSVSLTQMKEHLLLAKLYLKTLTLESIKWKIRRK